VYGGGGITPDVTIHPDTLSNPSLEIERRALLFQFANHYVASHPGLTLEQASSQALWPTFTAYLREQKFQVASDSLEMQKPYLDNAVHREIARRLGGDQAAFRVASEQDVMLQKAIDLVRRARAPRELLKLSMLH